MSTPHYQEPSAPQPVPQDLHESPQESDEPLQLNEVKEDPVEKIISNSRKLGPAAPVGRNPYTFKHGEYIVRKWLPSSGSRLHHYLNPMWYTMDSIDDFPLCWYGVPYRPRNFLEYAKELGIAGKPHLGVYCMPIVFRNIQLVFEADTGIRMRIEQVWGRPDYLILAFYSNREVADITLEKALEIEELLEEMDYPEYTKLRWWPDYYETR